MGKETLSKSLEINKQIIQETVKENEDVVFRDFAIANNKSTLIYVLGLSDVNQLSKFVLLPCTKIEQLPKQDKYKYLTENYICIMQTEEKDNLEDIVKELLKGKAILLLEDESKALVLSTDTCKERALSEPPTSAVLKGPRTGFVENIKTNLSEVRKILSTPDYKTIQLNVGKYTNTIINIVYISSIADKSIVDKIVKQIKSINIDGVIDSYYVAQFLEKRKYSMFKQVGNCEKPDIFCAKLLEGRVGILVDGSPIALTVPFLLLEDFQSANDYFSQHSNASFVRILRLFSLFITIMLPGMYISIQLHHYKTIPLKFLVTIINSTQGLPLTPFAEILFVLILFEVLYEASLRMPKYLGLALSIVGALILGDTAVKAGLISPPAVMMVALSGITLYTAPDQAQQLSICRFLFTLAGGFLGFFGIVSLLIFLVVYLNDFDSYGSPYLAPFSPIISKDLKDSIVKTDITKMKERPYSIKNKNKVRLRRK